VSTINRNSTTNRTTGAGAASGVAPTTNDPKPDVDAADEVVDVPVPSAADAAAPTKANINGMVDLESNAVSAFDMECISRGGMVANFSDERDDKGFFGRGFIETQVTPTADGCRIQVDSFHKTPNEKLTYLLQAEVYDTKANQLRTLSLAVLGKAVPVNGDKGTGQVTFEISYDDINKYLQAKNPFLQLNPGKTNLAVAALWVSSSGSTQHRAGGMNRGGKFRVPTPLNAQAGAGASPTDVRIGAMTGATQVSGADTGQALPVDLTVAYNDEMRADFKGIIKADGKVGTRAEKEYKGAIAGQKEWAEGVQRGYDLIKASETGNGTTIEDVLGKGWEISTVSRYHMNTEGDLFYNEDGTTNGTLQTDAHGLPVPEPMYDTYMSDKDMKATANEVVIRQRKNKQGNQVNVKPGGGVGDPELPQLKSRVEFFADLDDGASIGDVKKLFEKLDGSYRPTGGDNIHKQSPYNHGQKLINDLGLDSLKLSDCLQEVLELHQTRHKFTVKNDKGLEVELSIDEVTATTKRPEHNGPDGKPQSITFYQVEGEMDHVQLKTTSSAANFDLPDDVSSFRTDADQTKWLDATTKEAGAVTMDIEPRLHDIADLHNPAEKKAESYVEFKHMLDPLMDHLFTGGTTPAKQKATQAAELMNLLGGADDDG
jgi:hypothetical protein